MAVAENQLYDYVLGIRYGCVFCSKIATIHLSIKITLSHIRPAIWRRFLIVSTDSLADLHLVVQIVMGWTDSHLHEFVKGRERYGVPEEDSPSDMHDESEFRIDQVLKQEKDKLRYTYDFGDGWDHDLILEKIIPFETKIKLPACLKGSRACPP